MAQALDTAILSAAARAAAVVRDAPSMSAPVPGLSWDLAATANHLATETREYAQVLDGSLDPEESIRFASDARTPAERSARLNQRQLERNSSRDPVALAKAIEEAAGSYLDAARDRDPHEEILVTNGLRTSVDTVSRIILGEHLIHGLDLARAAGVGWEISPVNALEVIEGVIAVVPEYLDRDAAGNFSASYELRFRGGPAYRIDIDRGAARSGPSRGRADCIISADPVAFLLVGYGRIGQWGPMVRGQLRAAGRKPWLGFRFNRLLTSV